MWGRWLLCLALASGCVEPVEEEEERFARTAQEPEPVRTAESMNATPLHPAKLIRDTPKLPANVRALLDMRNELSQFLWGAGGFPTNKLPTSIEHDVPSPIDDLDNLDHVDNFRLVMDAGIESLAHYFVPAKSTRDTIVVLHNGHMTTFADDPSLRDAGYGMRRTLANLLADGYPVLAVYMPGCLPPQKTCAPHAAIVGTPTTGSGMKFFLEPVATYLNHLARQPDTAKMQFAMIGLSGGGWTTTVYSALDPRIRTSVAVAGSLPLSLRSGSSIGDEEQMHAPFYSIAGYPDLYLLASYGAGRSHVQVLNRRDDCCFGERGSQFDAAKVGMSYDVAIRSYERYVRGQLALLGEGAFRLEVDEAAPAHMISWNGIGNVLLPELDRRRLGRAPTAGDPSFTRGPDGTLVRTGPDGTENTGIEIVGTPVFARRSSGAFDVFARDPKSRLLHVTSAGESWNVEVVTDLVLGDPVLAAKDSQLDLAAVTGDYLPNHLRLGDVSVAFHRITGAPKVLGSPRLFVRESAVDVLVRGWDRVRSRWSVDPAELSSSLAGLTAP